MNEEIINIRLRYFDYFDRLVLFMAKSYGGGGTKVRGTDILAFS